MNSYTNKPLITGRIINAPNPGKNRQNSRLENGTIGTFAGLLGLEMHRKEEITFSKHAEQRMAARDISFSRDELERVNHAVREARQKGIRDSLIIMKDIALIVNVPNNTVVTAVQGDDMKQNVYTHIDGAVII